MRNSILVPMVIKKEGGYERAYDIYSRLLEERIIFLGGPIDDDSANIVIAQLLYLDHENKGQDINFYINSPGGAVHATLAILDTMNFVKSEVSTVCVGLAASGAAILLAGGQKGKRLSLPNSKIMIHQPLSGVEGQASDIAIHAEEILKTKKKLNEFLARVTGQKVEKVEKDTDRDYYMSAEEAAKYGIIDKVIGEDLDEVEKAPQK